jgi:hypothetical protein
VIRLTDWLRAPREERERARHACLDRIRTLDPSIHAWVQVSPQPAAGDGTLAGIPFGAKDIIETRGLATEYGSPVYKGRLGSEDAAIVRDLAARRALAQAAAEILADAYNADDASSAVLERAEEVAPGGLRIRRAGYEVDHDLPHLPSRIRDDAGGGGDGTRPRVPKHRVERAEQEPDAGQREERPFHGFPT